MRFISSGLLAVGISAIAATIASGAALRSPDDGLCPLCEAFSNCIDSCSEARHTDRGNRFCLERCRDAAPGRPLPASAFVGPEPPSAEEESDAWYKHLLKDFTR
eukprot:gnl/TRDRNA2_/TRDRNA2_184243_c0_seq1.p3 gnl/TRDRNA2_/TRDRNA2_184243_c0~~gnl/TRDRNA2_/TRDRNA2_184243_c0_seq1.p3  ORF type:complete len:104 (+),score=16.95 gnl/TRDRNA2_/TRDRNA2_184243_c0_seq1:99-410(+)